MYNPARGFDMHEEQALTQERRIGIDLLGLVALAAVAGVSSAVALAAIAMLIAGTGATTPAPETPVQAPAARTMLASGLQAS
jgi:hypothetical protein